MSENCRQFLPGSRNFQKPWIVQKNIRLVHWKRKIQFSKKLRKRFVKNQIFFCSKSGDVIEKLYSSENIFLLPKKIVCAGRNNFSQPCRNFLIKNPSFSAQISMKDANGYLFLKRTLFLKTYLVMRRMPPHWREIVFENQKKF